MDANKKETVLPYDIGQARCNQGGSTKTVILD